jgi:hypothetical protein
MYSTVQNYEKEERSEEGTDVHKFISQIPPAKPEA